MIGMEATLLRYQLRQQEEQIHRSQELLPEWEPDPRQPQQLRQQHRHHHHHQQQGHHQHHQHHHAHVPPEISTTSNGIPTSSRSGSLVVLDDHHQNTHHHHHHFQKQIRLKCVVLGAAGAGKTSILRRFFSGTFQPQGVRKPTLGADFYSGRVANPLYQTMSTTSSNKNNHHNNDNDNHHHHHDNNNKNHNNNHHDANNDSEDQRHSEQHKDDQQQQNREEQRRDDSSSSSIRWVDAILTQPTVLIQVWDTAGKERYAEQHGHKSKYTAALGDSFFRNVDAAMLVYDVTSSTSFTQLLKWHADLTARFQVRDDDHHTTKRRTTTTTITSLPFPVIIVGNKMDVLKREHPVPPFSRKAVVPKQRDVMGLNGQFRGKDSRYEYRVSSTMSSTPATSSTLSSSSSSSAAAAAATKQLYPHHRYLESSTYMATGETWTSDGSYLHSLLTTEDGSHPDREMVLLWCMRNGLKHFEVSALEGTGIDKAMEELVAQGLETRNRHELVAAAAEQQTTPLSLLYSDHDDDNNGNYLFEATMMSPPPQNYPAPRRNPSLDLQARYAPHDDQCCRPFGIIPPWWWWRKHLKI